MRTPETVRARAAQHHNDKLRVRGDKDTAVDQRLEPLLRELNRLGLLTLSHCSGRQADAYIMFDGRCFTGVESGFQDSYSSHPTLILRFDRVLDIDIDKGEDASDAIGRLFETDLVDDGVKLAQLRFLQQQITDSIDSLQRDSIP